MGQLPTEDTPAQQISVAFEAGNGRVGMRIPSGDKQLIIAMGHERASYLGNQLLEAAKKSTAPLKG